MIVSSAWDILIMAIFEMVTETNISDLLETSDF